MLKIIILSTSLLFLGCELKYKEISPEVGVFIDSVKKGNISDDRLLVGRYSIYQQGAKTRSFLKFDIRDIPKDLEGAILVLFLDSGDYSFDSPVDIGVYLIKEKWDKNTLSWDNQPAFENTPLTKIELKDEGGAPKKIQLDITSAVKAWRREDNFGILIRTIDEETYGTLKQFFGLGEKISGYTSSSFSKSLMPKLILIYR